jgi:uncharacterized membrane protein
MRKSQTISLIAVFGALHTALYFLSFGLWRNWAIYIEAIEGIILGPQAGFLAALFGSSIARIVRFDPFWMFGIVAEPISVLFVGLLSRQKWKPALLAYGAMLLAYFSHPFGRMLPLWTILDILLAFVMIYPAARLSKRLFGTDFKRMSISLILISFVGTAADSLVRVFLLIPGSLYALFSDFSNFRNLQVIFETAALSSYIEDTLVVIVSITIGVPLMIVLSKTGYVQQSKRENTSSNRLSG